MQKGDDGMDTSDVGLRSLCRAWHGTGNAKLVSFQNKNDKIREIPKGEVFFILLS